MPVRADYDGFGAQVYQNLSIDARQIQRPREINNALTDLCISRVYETINAFRPQLRVRCAVESSQGTGEVERFPRLFACRLDVDFQRLEVLPDAL